MVEAKEAGEEGPLGRRLISPWLGMGISAVLLTVAVALPTHGVWLWNPPNGPDNVWLLSRLTRYDHVSLQTFMRAAFIALLALTVLAPLLPRISLRTNLWSQILVVVLLEIATLPLCVLLIQAWVFRDALLPVSGTGLITIGGGTWALIGATAAQWVFWRSWGVGFVRKTLHPKRYPHRFDNAVTDGLRWVARNPGKSLPLAACGLQLLMVASTVTSATRFETGLAAVAMLKMLAAACVASLAAWGVMALIMWVMRGPVGVGLAILAGLIVVLLGWEAIQGAVPIP